MNRARSRARSGALTPVMAANNSATTFLPATTSLTASKGSNLTLTRADATSCATVVDFEGIVRVCKANEARGTGARRVENLLLDSENFSTANWASTFVGTGITSTKTPNYSLAPDGTMTACRVVLDKGAGNTAGDHASFMQNLSAATAPLIGSIWFKSTDGVSSYIVSLASNIEVVTVTGTWKRFSSSLNNIRLGAALRGTYGTSQTADILVWHPLLEDAKGQSNQNPSEYVASTESSAGALGVKYSPYTNGNTVASNIVTEATGTPLTTMNGLLTEPSRTNLVWPSGYGVAGVTQTTVSLTATSYTLSFKGTGSVTGTGGFVGTLNGTGANNTVSLTVTATAAAATLTVTGGITEMQLELGPNASSVIPTTTAAVTRAADVATIPTSGNITAAAGTIYVEWTKSQTGVQRLVTSFFDGTNYMQMVATDTTATLSKIVAGAAYIATSTVSTAIGTTYKIAASWGTSGVLISVSGVAGTPSANTTSAVIGSTAIVGVYTAADPAENTKNLRTWTTQLSQSQLNALTR